MTDVDEVRRERYCKWCNCPVTGNVEEHCDGRRHQSNIGSLRADEAAADVLVDNGFRCSACECVVSSSYFTALQHVQGAKHRKNVARRQQQQQEARQQQQQQQHQQRILLPGLRIVPSGAQSSSSGVEDVDEYTPGILQSGKCKLCSVAVLPKTSEVASMHVRGRNHQLKLRLLKVDWKGNFASLQEDQSGAKLTLLFNGTVLEGGRRISCEVGSQWTLAFETLCTSSRTLQVCGLTGVPSSQLQLMGFNLKLERPATLPPLHTLTRTCNAAPTAASVGTHRCLVAVQLRAGKKPIVLMRSFEIEVLPRGSSAEMRRMQEETAAKGKFVPKPRQNTAALVHAQFTQRVIAGQRPAALTDAKSMYVVKLGHFDLPRPVPPLQSMLARLAQPLSASNYLDRFRTLQQLEELQMFLDIQVYDRVATFAVDSKRPGLLRLKVEGLAESRPSVQKGDAIWACTEPFVDGNGRPRAHGAKVYEGFVHRVEMEYVFLAFHRDFHSNHIKNSQWHLRFTFNRIPIRRCHQGVQLAAQNAVGRVVFSGGLQKPALKKHTHPVPELTVTDQPAVVQRWIRTYVYGKHITRVGLDTESKMIPYASNELALIQIATPRAVLLFRVLTAQSLPPLMMDLLEDEDIAKISVGSEDSIEECYNCQMGECVDVQQLAKREDNLKQLPGTQELANKYAPHLLFIKDKRMQTSDWGRWPLTAEQQRYAADDALVALAIGRSFSDDDLAAEDLEPFTLLEVAERNKMAAATSALAASSSSSSSSSFSVNSSAAPFKMSPYTSKPLNAPQIAAVQSILSGQHHPYPFVLFGPPGTGKTTVLCEAIQQLLRQQNGVRILAVAPSNAASDLFVERLKNLSTMELFRLNAVSRSSRDAPEVVRKYSHVVDDGFGLRTRAELLKYKVIVSTAVSGSCLSSLGLLPGDFTHIIIDESGHATEPEAMATLGGLIDSARTRVILGGDPQQLGPIIRNASAIKHGLGISFLERLILDADKHSNSPYHRLSGAKAYPEKYMVKLLFNYRSHPAILSVPNKLFYDNELKVAADELERQALCRWPGWPSSAGGKFPLLMHHVEGLEQQEGTSPSWFNLTEALLIMSYIEALLEWKPAGLRLADIGIITPYNRQVQKLRSLAASDSRKWNADPSNQLSIGTVETFQGQERRVILVSTVRSQMQNVDSFDVKFQLGFVHQPKRLNVALTRAKQALIVVGNARVLETDKNWNIFMQHCYANGGVLGSWKPKSAVQAGASSSSSAAPAGSADDDDGLGELLSSVEAAREAKVAAESGAHDDDAQSDDDEEWEHVRSNEGAPWKADF